MGASGQPVDLEHLDRYTGGNRALNEEIFRLFETQCREIMAELEALAEAGPDEKSWRQITHTLKGAARGIGAFSLGEAAAEAEKAGHEKTSSLAALERLKTTSAAVHLFIDEFLAAAS